MTKSKFRPKETAKKGRKKQDKLHLVFNPDARKEFLNGFRKRKQEKKVNFKLRMAKKVAAEKQRIRAEAKKSVTKLSASHSVLPEVEALLADQLLNFSTEDSYEIGSKTVTITNLDKIKPVVLDNSCDDNEDEDEDNEDNLPENQPQLNAKTKTLLKKSTNRLLQHSKIYKAAQRMKSKKSKHHQRHAPGKNNSKDKDSKAELEANKHFKGKGKPPKAKGRRGRGKK